MKINNDKLFNNYFRKAKNMNQYKLLIKNIYLDLIKNNFNYIEMEFNVINSEIFIQYINHKLV